MTDVTTTSEDARDTLSPALTVKDESKSSRPVKRDARGCFVRGSGRPVRRRGGGTLGNLNAVKNPWATYWRRRALRPEDRWVLRLVEDYVPNLIADKGGLTEVSFAELKVMELAGVARVCLLLALPAKDFEAVARFIGAERSALADIGLKRRPRPVPSVSQYLAGGKI